MIKLLLNAAEALEGSDPQSGLIQIAMSKDDSGSILLVIQDNGHGIAEDQLERVFEPFIGNKKQGKGIGLSIVRNIAEEHKGSILLDSVVDEGTTITVRLPAATRSGTLLSSPVLPT